MSRRFKIVQSEHLSPEAAAWLGERCELVACPHDDPRFGEQLKDADAIIVRTYTIVDDELLDRAPKLRVVGRAGVGLDNFDLDACARRGVTVLSTPDANTQAVVEYVVALLCDALRPRVTLDRAVDSEAWDRLRAEVVGERQMSELTLGILGLGRIGRRVAEVAKAIGFTVLFNDLVVPDPPCPAATSVSVNDLFSRSDVLSVHIDGREGNRGFVGGRLINRMKSDVIFVNTSRGFVVNSTALAGFLRSQLAAQAHLDVHEPEPFGPDYPLLGLANARLYPHLASRTQTAMSNMSWVVRDVWAALQRMSE